MYVYKIGMAHSMVVSCGFSADEQFVIFIRLIQVSNGLYRQTFLTLELWRVEFYTST